MSQDQFDGEDTTAFINHSFDIEGEKCSERRIMMDLSRLSHSKTMSTDELHSMMVRKVKRITEVFPYMASTRARALLMKHRWDVNRALESAFDTEFSDDEAESSSSKASLSSDEKNATCEICLVDQDDKRIQALPCQHKFCNVCLAQHISIFVNESSGLARNAVCCPGFKCSTEVSDEIVLRLIDDKSDLRSKYARMISNAYVQSNVYIQWCPRSGCSNAVKIDEGAIKTKSDVRCSCRNWFCFQCQEPSHEPLSCDKYKLWMTVTSEEALSQNWIMKNSKKCPNTACRVDIQKNGGCTHMTCRNCKHEFCWICLGVWTRDGRHQCLVDTEKNGAGDSEFKFVSRLQHFNSHYQKMLELMRVEAKTFDEIKKEIGNEVELPNGYIRTDFIDNAFEVLQLCRRTLMFSYAFNYYMTTFDNQIYVFEQKLTNLEQCTDKLAEVIKIIEVENLNETKVKLIDASLVSLKCRTYILENIQEGNEKGYWLKFPIPADMFVQEAVIDDYEYDPRDFL